MAVDQAIAESTDVPTLRFYSWSVPTLSLGYFQERAQRDGHRPSSVLPMVRRSTGGGAIVHDRELTYSLVVPEAYQQQMWASASSSAGASLQLYEAVHGSVIAVLRRWGCQAELAGPQARNEDGGHEPFLCFQRRSEWDVIVGGYKVLGSAQRRLRSAVLQHGSLLLQASGSAPELPGVGDVASVDATAEQFANALLESLESRLRIRWQPGGLSAAEGEAARQIQRSRFEAEGWLSRR